MTPKHIPQRTCVSCRSTGARRALVRLVRTEIGVEVDLTGRRNGRGAYLCQQQACWNEALKRNRLGAALRTAIASENSEMLRTFAERFERSEAARVSV